ncbi:cyclopropane fatty acyl phospholipid synthase [Polynucleobacter sinensis]|uniref:cyclopropane fatty acyl phospholipid synthase n=1 Tax=Polynucleobacter sinensis TaxID=1743157 RepID=UPI000780E302|nr:cyclopropane fatty acyl phospholipid synthase [Polynucleobacter sinensis]
MLKKLEIEKYRIPTIIQEIFNSVGIVINGSNPWDIQILNERAFNLILSKWSLGLGEGYMRGYWDCLDLEGFLYRLLKHDHNEKIRGFANFNLLYEVMRAKLLNLQSKSRAFMVGQHHYDVGQDVFAAMLDKEMMYSCAYWEHAHDLDKAQLDKMELICRKLQLKAGESLLEIGCGWGGFARYAAQNYGVRVLGVTISQEQYRIAKQKCGGENVEILLSDYRDLEGQFDKIVSIGMFEHVGEKNYQKYFSVASRLLADNGIFLLHTIGSDVTTLRTDPWIEKYIFPNGKIPSIGEIGIASEGHFIVEDLQNIGLDYEKTLLAWHQKFISSWPSLSYKYDSVFYRMWIYYLLGCAAYFKSRQGQLWQLVFTKRNFSGVYRSIRM